MEGSNNFDCGLKERFFCRRNQLVGKYKLVAKLKDNHSLIDLTSDIESCRFVVVTARQERLFVAVLASASAISFPGI